MPRGGEMARSTPHWGGSRGAGTANSCTRVWEGTFFSSNQPLHISYVRRSDTLDITAQTSPPRQLQSGSFPRPRVSSQRPREGNGCPGENGWGPMDRDALAEESFIREGVHLAQYA